VNKMKIILLSLLFITLISSTSILWEFASWQVKYKKIYTNPYEIAKRSKIFITNYEYIENHNKRNLSYTLALNQYADLTNDEYRQLYLRNIQQVKRDVKVNGGSDFGKEENFDWRDRGVVSSVKEQGQCGSCWAFTAIGAVESACAIAGLKPSDVSLSAQQLMDCSGSYGNMGCNGGLMDQAFQYLMDVKNINTESDYPYNARDGDKCLIKNNTAVKCIVTGFKDLPEGNEVELTNAVKRQPISMAIDGGHSSFQFYSSGIYSEPSCNKNSLSHSMIITGYGKDKNGLDYYICKNSWGTDWGMSGYVWMARNKNNMCGVATMGSYPIVKVFP